jgi:hypothetical protein
VRRKFGDPRPVADDPLRERLDDLAVLTGKALAQRNAERQLDNLEGAEFKVFSQFGDDGIIDYIAAHLALPRSRQRFVEIGVEDYSEANTRFLLVNRNWSGLVVDASDAHVRRLENSALRWRHDLHAVTARVDRDDVNALLREHGFDRELGLLSIDVDGNDYWIWEAIEAEPAIVVVEYNSLFGPRKAVTIPYDPDFERTKAHHSSLYFGASLPALVRLGESRGYRLVGSNSAGVNAFFVRNDLAERLPAPSVADAYVESRIRESRDEAGNLTYLSGRDRIAAIAELEVWDLDRQAPVRVADL